MPLDMSFLGLSGLGSMALVPGWLPPSRENWELLAYAWQFFPVVYPHQPNNYM